MMSIIRFQVRVMPFSAKARITASRWFLSAGEAGRVGGAEIFIKETPHARRGDSGENPFPPNNETNPEDNRHFYGFECENLGDGDDPWPAAQLKAIERVSAAVCRYHGWTERSVIGHLEWQPGKVDPRGFTMSWLRGRIRERLN